MGESSRQSEAFRDRAEAVFVPEPEPVSEREVTFVKVGTDSARDWETVLRILEEIETLRGEGFDQDVVVIWSRGVRTGMELEDVERYPEDLTEMRFLSGIGWPEFVHDLAETLDRRPLPLAITRQDLRDPKTHARLHELIRYALADDRLVFANEDDTRSDEEFEKVGTVDFLDNDGLARRLAVDCMATRLIVVTDVPGVYDKDPKAHDDAQKFDRIPAGEAIAAETSGKSRGGRGGMTSKRDEIELARSAGIEVFVTDATAGQIVAAVDPDREFLGTHLEAHPQEADST